MPTHAKSQTDSVRLTKETYKQKNRKPVTHSKTVGQDLSFLQELQEFVVEVGRVKGLFAVVDQADPFYRKFAEHIE